MKDRNKINPDRLGHKLGSTQRRLRNIHARSAAGRQDIQTIQRDLYAYQWSNPAPLLECDNQNEIGMCMGHGRDDNA